METPQRGQEMHERAPLPQALLADFEAFGKSYGAEALRDLILSLHKKSEQGELLGRGEFQKFMEHRVPRERFQEEALAWLVRDGFVKKREDGVLVVDTAHLFKDFSLKKYSRRYSVVQKKEIRSREVAGIDDFGKSRHEFFANVFDGKEVLLKDQEEDPDATPKPLFYLPKTRAEALDLEAIRKADFHFGLWEFAGIGQSLDALGGARNPGAIDDLSYLEASTAAVIYHPRYGAGERKDRGRLIVRDADGSPKRLSGAWLASRISLAGPRFGNLFSETPLEVLEQHLPHLLERGLLAKEDFRVATTHQEKDRLITSEKGLVNYQGIRYSLGKSWAKKALRIEPVMPGLGAVIALDESGHGHLAATIRLHEKGGDGLVFRPTSVNKKTGFWEAGVAETALESFDEGVFHRRKGKESDVAMRERIKAMESLQLFLLTDGALREAGVILRDLPKSEVDAFRAAKGVHEKARGALVELSRFVGSDAVRFANLVADIPEVVSEFAPLLSQLPSGDQRLVFSSLMEAAQARRDAIEVLEERVLNKSMSESDARLARHAFNEQLLVVLALPAARQKTREAMASGDILQMLQKRSDASRMSARLFHDAFKGSGDKIELNDVVGVEFRRTDPGELTEKERQAMQTIHWENWKSQPETAAILQKKFERTLQGGLRTFYLLKKDGAVAGFARFDFEDADGRPLPRGETYFGSFNVTPAMRGSAMGEAMLRNMFDAQSDMTIHFESDTRHAISMKYVEDGKAVIEKVERYVDDTPDDIFHLRTSPAIRKGYKGKEMQKDVMVRGKVSAPLKVESFSRRDEAVDAIERELKSGRVVSRFFEDRGTFFILSEPKLSEEAP